MSLARFFVTIRLDRRRLGIGGLGIDFVPVPIQFQSVSALYTDAALRLVQPTKVIARRESGAYLMAWLKEFA